MQGRALGSGSYSRPTGASRSWPWRAPSPDFTTEVVAGGTPRDELGGLATTIDPAAWRVIAARVRAKWIVTRSERRATAWLAEVLKGQVGLVEQMAAPAVPDVTLPSSDPMVNEARRSLAENAGVDVDGPLWMAQEASVKGRGKSREGVGALSQLRTNGPDGAAGPTHAAYPAGIEIPLSPWEAEILGQEAETADAAVSAHALWAELGNNLKFWSQRQFWSRDSSGVVRIRTGETRGPPAVSHVRTEIRGGSRLLDALDLDAISLGKTAANTLQNEGAVAKVTILLEPPGRTQAQLDASAPAPYLTSIISREELRASSQHLWDPQRVPAPRPQSSRPWPSRVRGVSREDAAASGLNPRARGPRVPKAKAKYKWRGGRRLSGAQRARNQEEALARNAAGLPFDHRERAGLPSDHSWTPAPGSSPGAGSSNDPPGPGRQPAAGSNQAQYNQAQYAQFLTRLWYSTDAAQYDREAALRLGLPGSGAAELQQQGAGPWRTDNSLVRRALLSAVRGVRHIISPCAPILDPLRAIPTRSPRRRTGPRTRKTDSEQQPWTDNSLARREKLIKDGPVFRNVWHFRQPSF